MSSLIYAKLTNICSTFLNFIIYIDIFDISIFFSIYRNFKIDIDISKKNIETSKSISILIETSKSISIYRNKISKLQNRYRYWFDIYHIEKYRYFFDIDMIFHNTTVKPNETVGLSLCLKNNNSKFQVRILR